MKRLIMTISLFLVSLSSYATVGGIIIDDGDNPAATIPEPSTLALFGAAALAVIVAKKFKK